MEQFQFTAFADYGCLVGLRELSLDTTPLHFLSHPGTVTYRLHCCDSLLVIFFIVVVVSQTLRRFPSAEPLRRPNAEVLAIDRSEQAQQKYIQYMDSGVHGRIRFTSIHIS